MEKGGRLISGMEQACVVASIKTIRPNRYHVQTDCREFDEIYQQSFILDAPSRELFRIEGDEYLWCLDVDGSGVAVLPARQPKPSLADDLKRLSNAELAHYWGDQNEGCRGGPGDAPETQEACGRREIAADELARRKFCYRAVKGAWDWLPCR